MGDRWGLLLMTDYKNTEKVLKAAADFFASQARLELKATRPRTAIRADWKKVGNGWQVVGVRKQKFRAPYVASGNLVNSIKPISRGLEFGISMDWYGQAIIKGRKPWPNAEFKGDKGIPLATMKSWATMKKMKPKDPATGKFLENSDKNKRAMQFMMNRKIKHFGIEPFDFRAIAYQTTMSKYRDKINDAVKQDIENQIKGDDI